jgi:hypothetical protein
MVLRSASRNRLVDVLAWSEYSFITYNVRELGKCLEAALEAYDLHEHFCKTHQLGDLKLKAPPRFQSRICDDSLQKRLQLTASLELNPEHGFDSCLQLD